VAALAACCGGQVIARFTAQYIPVVATQALTADRNVLMKYPRIPAGIATLVTAVTVADCNTRQRPVWNMVGCRSIRRWIGSTVTGRTLIGNQGLGVIPTRRFPSRHAMTTGAVGAGRNVNTALSCGIRAVMATGTIACRGERAVIRLGAGPVGGGLVTAVTSRQCWQMSR
jgi:hypothetical protein